MATFVIGGTTATFGAMIRGASREAGDLQRLSVGVNLVDNAAFVTMESLVTTKYHIHIPMGGTPVIDVVRGAGEGTLTITGLGAVTALLVSLASSTFLKSQRNIGTAQFVITGTWA